MLVVRGPAPLAKTIGALDVLSGGRALAGVGPGSSARDYAAAGVPFEERWRRFDEALRALRELLHGDVLPARPVQRPGPPIWVASWGSPAGLRRVARHGDGWLASAYNITPERFTRRRPHSPMPNGLATAWLCVTEDAAERDGSSPTCSPRSSAGRSSSCDRSRCPSGRPRSARSA